MTKEKHLYVRRLVKLAEKTRINVETSYSGFGVKIMVTPKLNGVNNSPIIFSAPCTALPNSAVNTNPPTIPTHDLRSTLVGTVYLSSNGSLPFVQKGDHVSKGQVLCLIEAMHLKNEVKADFPGIVDEILVASEQPVEFDQIIFKIIPI